MNGQLYQECSKSGCYVEPVCSMCEFCERHCICPSQEEQIEVEKEMAEARTINQGFGLIGNYIKEYGKPCKYPIDNKTIANTRYYNIGAGWGPGNIFSVDMAGTIYLTVHTGSDVPEWASHSYILPEAEDTSFDNSNAKMVTALERLEAKKPLTRKQQKAFSI